MFTDLLFRIRSVLRRASVEKQLDEELRFHQAAQIEKSTQSGLTPEEAARHSRLQFGGLDQLKEECRDSRGVNFIESLARDVRYALRTLRKSLGFTVTTVFVLAAGIGANAAIFSVVEDVLLRPLPFSNPNRLIDLTEYLPGKVESAGIPYPDYLAWKQATTSFDGFAAYSRIHASNDIVLGMSSSAERVRYSTVSNSFFDILGTHPALGHGFSTSSELPGGPKLFLVSDAVWHASFGGDIHAIGKPYLLDGASYTLSGVMPAGFDFPDGCGVWVPLGTLGEAALHDRVSHPFHVLGRLRPGVTLTRAWNEVGAVQTRLAKIYPATDAGWRVRVLPLLDEITGNVRTSLFVLLGAVASILLIACTNVANLLLARASARQREFTIRASLGAGRWRLLGQSLTETALLVSASLVAAATLANWGLKLIAFWAPYQLPRLEPFRLSLPVVLFMALAGTLTVILVGLVPALEISRRGIRGTIHNQRSVNHAGPRQQRFRDLLVVSQVTLALLLLCGAGLMLRSFTLLTRVHPGFETGHLMALKLALPGAAYPRAQQTQAFFDRLQAAVRSLPEVEDAASTSTVPLSGESEWNTFQVADHQTGDWTHAPAAGANFVSTNYFKVLQIPVVQGRDFTAADSRYPAVIINEAMAKKFWPASSPLGQHILSIDEPSRPLEIVGVVRNTKGSGLRQASQPEMYTPYRGAWYMSLLLRTRDDPARILSKVRQQVAAIDKGVPVYQVATMDRILSSSVAPERFETSLLALFATLAVTLAAVGLYGVISFAVSQRTQEFGLRMALGARRENIFALIASHGMRLVLVGIVLGLVASFSLTRLMSSLLYGVSAADPLTFAVVATLLAAVSFVACCLPAWRAMRVDPMVALKYE